MEKYRIYLAGGMEGLDECEAYEWRKSCEEYFANYLTCNVLCFNPIDYYNYSMDMEKEKITEGEIRRFELYSLKKSDLVLVNFNAPRSIGTAQELAVAKENGIPVIGVNEANEIHPWLLECVDKMFDNMSDALFYIENYYLQY